MGIPDKGLDRYNDLLFVFDDDIALIGRYWKDNGEQRNEENSDFFYVVLTAPFTVSGWPTIPRGSIVTVNTNELLFVGPVTISGSAG